MNSKLAWLATPLLLVCLHIAEAQQPNRIPRIGFVAMSSSATGGQNLQAFRLGLREFGYVEGSSILLEPRWAEGWAERLPSLLDDLIQQKVDIIVLSSAAGALAAKKATSTIPVVFAAVTDPFEHGLIASLARPGSNLTGTSLAVGEGFGGKWVEFLKLAASKVASFSVLWNPIHPVANVFAKEVKLAAQALAIAPHFSEARDPKQLEAALANIERGRPAALPVIPDPIFFSQESLLPISRSSTVCRRPSYLGNLLKPAASCPMDPVLQSLIGVQPSRGQDSQRNKARRLTGRATDKIRVSNQFENCQTNRSDNSAECVGAGRTELSEEGERYIDRCH
jgi:ABC-type uncharacterized transport system substrate-binding protein